MNSYGLWEEDVELFREVCGRLVSDSDAQVRELKLSDFSAMGSLLLYRGADCRKISIEVIGGDAEAPLVQTTVTEKFGHERVKEGELLGCRKEGDTQALLGELVVCASPLVRLSDGLEFMLPMVRNGFTVLPPLS